MGIPDLVRRKVRNPDGGIGGLTDAELAPFNDLLNDAQPCECGGACCGSPLIDPNRKRP